MMNHPKALFLSQSFRPCGLKRLSNINFLTRPVLPRLVPNAKIYRHNQFSKYSTSNTRNGSDNRRFSFSGVLIGSICLFGTGIYLSSPSSHYSLLNIIHNDEHKQKFEKSKQQVDGPQPFVENKWQESPDSQPHNSLTPDPSQATFEMGLYAASKAEQEELEMQYRKERTNRKFTGWLFRIGFFLQDYFYEPVVTFGRFIELSVIFVPVFVLYPITFFGKTDKTGERSGARLWYWLLRNAAEMGGASFIKLGQWAASRTDIFTKGLCKEMSNLHSNAKEHSFRETRRILRETFNGRELEEIFDEFPEKPVGCGAIAQVYLARLNQQFVGSRDTHDTLVAVKVLHPRVTKNISRDLKIMSFFANLIDVIPTMEWLSLPQEVEQFAILMNLQLDLRIESYNLNKFREKFAKTNDVFFPKPRYSSRKILIEDQVYGVSMNKILELKHVKNGKMLKFISDRLIDSFLKMMILDNFTHADLHPGNIFVRFVKSDGYNHGVGENNAFETDKLTTKLNDLGVDELNRELNALVQERYVPQLCFIDAGLVTELDDQNRFNFISLFNALAQFDGYKAGELMIERSKTPETAVNKELFKLKVERLVNKVKERTFTLGAVSIGDLLDNMLSMVRSHHVRMEGDFVSIVVAILILEGICRQLDPDIDLFARWVFAWTVGFPTMQF